MKCWKLLSLLGFKFPSRFESCHPDAWKNVKNGLRPWKYWGFKPFFVAYLLTFKVDGTVNRCCSLELMLVVIFLFGEVLDEVYMPAVSDIISTGGFSTEFMIMFIRKICMKLDFMEMILCTGDIFGFSGHGAETYYDNETKRWQRYFLYFFSKNIRNNFLLFSLQILLLVCNVSTYCSLVQWRRWREITCRK